MDFQHTFETKSGKQAEIRYPRMEDVEQMLEFINDLSSEDTYILMSGQQLTLEEERNYLEGLLEKIKAGDTVSLVCMVDGKLVGKCDVDRVTARKERSKHVGMLHLAIAQDYRGEGIGYEISQKTLEQAERKIEGLRMFELDLFGNNEAGKGLYEKLGFREVGRIPGKILHQGEYVDMVVMIREIGS